jgi:hypothetical protein
MLGRLMTASVETSTRACKPRERKELRSTPGGRVRILQDERDSELRAHERCLVLAAVMLAGSHFRACSSGLVGIVDLYFSGA